MFCAAIVFLVPLKYQYLIYFNIFVKIFVERMKIFYIFAVC